MDKHEFLCERNRETGINTEIRNVWWAQIKNRKHELTLNRLHNRYNTFIR